MHVVGCAEGGQSMMRSIITKKKKYDNYTHVYVPVCVVPEPGAFSASHELPSRYDLSLIHI